MSSAVQDLRNAILGGRQPLSQLLRQAKVIAAALNLEDFEQWVDLELNGYPHDTRPPTYREYFTASLSIRNPYRGWQFAGDLRIGRTAYEAITEIQTFSELAHPSIPVSAPFPIQSDYEGVLDWPQRLLVETSEFKRILEAVTNRLLQWTLELETRGIKGEDMNFNEEEKQAAGAMTINIGTDILALNVSPKTLQIA